jgi:hypothetical protein
MHYFCGAHRCVVRLLRVPTAPEIRCCQLVCDQQPVKAGSIAPRESRCPAYISAGSRQYLPQVGTNELLLRVYETGYLYNETSDRQSCRLDRFGQNPHGRSISVPGIAALAVGG